MMIMILLITFICMLSFKMKQKCRYLIENDKKRRLEEHEDPKTFIEYSNNMQDIYKNNLKNAT